MSAAAGLGLLHLLAWAGGLTESEWYVDPITVKVMHDQRAPFPFSARQVDLAGQRGECERAQIWGWDTAQALVNVRLDFSVLDLIAPLPISSSSTTRTPPAHLPPTIWTWKQQGYVHTNGTRHYTCLEDILLWNRSSAPAVNRSECANTPQGNCMSGCPADPKGRCLGGNAPAGSCNMCDCNVHHTTCPPVDWSHLCLPGWYPDPLLDIPATGVPLIPAGFTQPMVVEACIPYGTTAGNYSGVISVTHQAPVADTARTGTGTDAGTPQLVARIPVRLEVWTIDLPRLNDSGAFNTAFRFDSDMHKWYPAGTTPAETWADWMPFLAHHRIPADDIYLLSPRPTAEYEELAATGAKRMAMMCVADPPAPPGYVDHVIDTLAPTLANMSRLGILDKVYVYGFDEMPQNNANMQGIYQIFGGLKAKWPNITTMAVLDWESMPSDIPLDIWVDEARCAISRQEFTLEDAIGSHACSLEASRCATNSIPLGCPLLLPVGTVNCVATLKVDDYGTSLSFNEPTVKEKRRQSWLASSPTHQYWWYWCINPQNPTALNTFVERPAIQGRLLFWLSVQCSRVSTQTFALKGVPLSFTALLRLKRYLRSYACDQWHGPRVVALLLVDTVNSVQTLKALHAINGMLYYDVAIWSEQCPSQRPCKPTERINGTGLTDFNPATWNGNGHSTDGVGGANGDGSFTYPGPGGKPLGSIRLSNIADGIEDWELFNRLGTTTDHLAKGADLITRLITNITHRTEDPRLLEMVRREAAHRIMAGQLE
jgi:hypothetical protein